MVLKKKVLLCQFSENNFLDTPQKWLSRFPLSNLQRNVVYYDLEDSDFHHIRFLNDENVWNTNREYYFLVIEDSGVTNIQNENIDYVSGYFCKSLRFLPSKINFNSGEITDEQLGLDESTTVVSRFMYFITDRILFYEYNHTGVGYFSKRLQRYLWAIFRDDTLELNQIMSSENMRDRIRQNLIKKFSMRVAATNPQLVNEVIGLPMRTQFIESLGDENYNITIIVSSNRSSHISNNFVNCAVNAYERCQDKDEIKKLEFKLDDDMKLDLTSSLRFKLEPSFETLSTRSRRITKDSFESIIKRRYTNLRESLLGDLD